MAEKTKVMLKRIAIALCYCLFSTYVSAQSPGIECGCDKYASYVAPAGKGILLETGETVNEAHSPGNRYQVEVESAIYPNTVHITVKHNSLPVLSESFRATGWGFSPDEDRFVIHGLDLNGWHVVWLYNLDPDPSVSGEQASGGLIIGPTDVSSASIVFSPHGNYMLYGAIGNNNGNLVLNIFDSKTNGLVYNATGGSDLIGLPSGGSVAGWGFSPDSRDRTFVHSILTHVDEYSSTYTLIVRNLETGADVLNAPGSRGGASFRFSPCGDYFLWIHNDFQGSPVCKFYRTSEINDTYDEEGSGIDLQDIYTEADGHYIRYSNGSVNIFDNTADTDCEDKDPPSWPAGASLSAPLITGSMIELAWPAATEGKGVISYRIYQDGLEISTLQDLTSIQIAGLEQDTEYDFEVQAGDEAGNFTSDGPAGSFTTLTDPEPEWTGGYFNEVYATGTTLRLQWGGATDTWGIKYYRISQLNGQAYIVPGDSSNFTIRGLEAALQYTFNIEAGDESDQWVSGPSFTYTMPDDNSPYWPPGSLILIDETTETSASFTWDEAADDFGVKKYRIERDGLIIDSTTYINTTYEDHDLEQGDSYVYRIYAGDESGNWSDPLETEIQTMPSFVELPLAIGPGVQKLPDISDQIVVWQDDRNGNDDIFEYFLAAETEVPLVTNPLFQGKPAVSGERIIWEDAREGGGNTDIYIHYPWQGDIAVCDDPGTQTSPDISGTYVVWMDLRDGDWDIYLYNLVTLEEKEICSANGRQAFPSISGHIVVWEDYRNGDADIYGYNIYTDEEFEVCTDPGNQTRPVADVNNVLDYKIVWVDDSGIDLDIYMWTTIFNTAFTMKLNLGYSSNQTSPHINDNQLVYMDDKNGSWDIYAYQFYSSYYGDIVPVCTADGDQLYPRTSKGRVVWEDRRNDDGDIYIWDRPPGTDLALYLNENNDPAPVGRLHVYELTARNEGPDTEPIAYVECLLPADAMFSDMSYSHGTATKAGQTITWDVGSLENDSSAVIRIEMLAYDVTTLTFSASIKGSGFDPDPSNNMLEKDTEVKLVVSEELKDGMNPSLAAEKYGKVHMVYGTSDSIVYASKIPQGAWIFENADTVHNYTDSDILLDADQTVHISYSDNIYDMLPSSRLYFLSKSSMGWNNRIIALSDSGFSSQTMDITKGSNIHLLYQQSPGAAYSSPFKYISNVSGLWTHPQLFYSQGYDHIDMVLDSEGYAHTCFIGINIGPQYRKSADTIISSWHSTEIIEENWRGAQLEGMVVDIAVDSSDSPHIIYPGGTNGDGLENIKYATKKDGQWHIKQIDKGSSGSGANAIVAEPSGKVHVSYMHMPSGEIRYATNIAGPWIRQTIEENATGWMHTLDMERDDYGNCHLAFEKDGIIRYALRPPVEYFTVSPDTLDFGIVEINSSKTIYLGMLNKMSNSIRIESIYAVNSEGFTTDKNTFILHRNIADSVAVTFSPLEETIADTYLRINFISNSRLYIDIPLIAKTPVPQITVDPDPVNFDIVTPYTQDTRTVSISNTGELDLLITEIEVKYELFGYEFPTDFHLVGHTCDILTPGTSCEAEVDFYPMETGSQQSYLNITSNDPLNPYRQVRISGSSRYPRALITTSANELDFGYTETGLSPTLELWIYSVGENSLDISNITVTGTNAANYSVNHSCSSVLPGDSCLLEITFSPVSPEEYGANLNIYSNSEYSNPKIIALNGSAIWRQITLSESELNFGERQSGHDSTRIISLANNGLYDISVSGTSINGSDIYEFLHTGFSGIIAPGESVNDTIVFSPVFEGNKVAVLRIESNDSEAGLKEIVLSGRCIAGIPGLQSSISANPLSGAAPLEVDFTADISGGVPPYTFSWLFGDGGSSNLQNPTHTYSEVNTYNVEFTVSDSEDNSLTEYLDIYVAEAAYSLSGEIYGDDGLSPVNYGIVELYKQGNYDFEQQINLSGVNSYQFSNITVDEYTIKFYPDPDNYPDFLPSYYGDVLYLYDASYVLTESDLESININLVRKPGTGDGEGTISGYVQEGSQKGDIRITPGSTKSIGSEIEGVYVYLKDSFSDKITGFDITDNDGLFKISDLHDASYELIADYKGLPMDPANPLLTIDPDHDSLSIMVTVSATEISSEIIYTGIEELKYANMIRVYPNPSSGIIYIEDPDNYFTNDDVRVSLIELKGNIIKTRQYLSVAGRSNSFSLKGVSKGMYVLKIESGDKSYSTRIVIR